MPRAMKDLVAILLAAFGAFLGIFGMINSEMQVVVPALDKIGQPEVVAQMVHGLKNYCAGLGLLLLMVSFAYMLVGQDDPKEETRTLLTSDKK